MESSLMKNICSEMWNPFGVQGERVVALFQSIGFTYGYSGSTTSWLAGKERASILSIGSTYGYSEFNHFVVAECEMLKEI
jgi:hypothetical protein